MIDLSENLKNEIFEISKNAWLSGLFSSIPSFIPNISFEEHKEIFFYLVREFLEKGLIKFDTPPTKEFSGRNGIWQEENSKIFQYLYDGFPKQAIDENDEEVNLYFYMVAPPVLWLQEDGSYGSM